MKKFLLILSYLLVLLVPNLSADGIKVFQLKDGSSLKGQLVSFNSGVLTPKTLMVSCDVRFGHISTTMVKVSPSWILVTMPVVVVQHRRRTGRRCFILPPLLSAQSPSPLRHPHVSAVPYRETIDRTPPTFPNRLPNCSSIEPIPASYLLPAKDRNVRRR